MAEERIYGPYPHRNKWRVVVVRSDGERITGSYSSAAAAQKAIDDVREKTDSRTVSGAVDEYVHHLRALGRKAGTIDTIKYRLRGMLRTNEREASLRSLTPASAKALFARRALELAGETQHGELATASAFASWCVSSGWLKADPFASLTPTKPRRTGKPQLRIDEARRWLDAALAENSDESLAAALTMLMGLRASEVTNRAVRDVDDGARVLWIDRAKTRAGNRSMEIPSVLRPALAALIAGRAGGEPLWRAENRDRHWVYRHVRRLCRAAGVPVVSPHGMRGTFASIASRTQSTEDVARSLGHAGPGVTRRHYLEDGAERNGQQRAALRVLVGGG